MRKLFVILMPLFLMGCWTLEEGEKIGQIISVYKSGFFVKTWELVLIRGGLEDGSGSIGNKFQCTIEDKHLVSKAKDIMKSKKNARIKFHGEFITFARSDSDGYFLDEIEENK